MWRLLLMALAAVAAVAAVAAYDADDRIPIGVLEESPEQSTETQAAVLSAGGEARVAGGEPGARAAVPHLLCRLASEGVASVISGVQGVAGAALRAAARRAGVALWLTRDARAAPAALPLLPAPTHLATAAKDLMAAKGWKRGVLLQEGGVSGAALVADETQVAARVLPRDPALLRNLLLLLKRGGEHSVAVWASAPRSAQLLDAAQCAGMLDQRHAYLLLDLDAHTQPLDVYSHAGANITGLRLFEPQAPAARIALEAWAEQFRDLRGATAHEIDSSDAPTHIVLAVDAANLTQQAMRHLRLPVLRPADCASGEAAFHADTLLNYLRSEEWEGASGALHWSRDGSRGAARLAVTELARGGSLAVVGRWSPLAPLRWTRPPAPTKPVPQDSITNRTFNILILQNEPYVMRQESTGRLSGNDRYEGFCIELIERLANQLGFNYTFIEQTDRQYGTKDKKTGNWSGMIGRLINDPNIDFAITDLTITEERVSAIDFTTSPFMNLGISILFHKPLPPKPKLFAFLLPFSNDVWICLGMSYLITSLVLWIVGRLCPAEWQNPHPCVEDPPALHNQFTLPNALWFNLGAVLLQGSEIAPVGYGTRAVASVWWVFALVITSSYTANLATLLAKKSSTELIHNVEELVNNTHGITYGALKGGATYRFFEQSKSEIYQRMFQHISTRDELPSGNKEGIEWVNKAEGTYAFLMESTTIEYATERNCNVTQVGGLLDNKGYGIAMKKNSTYQQALSLALLKLQEEGVLREMKRTWWKEKHGGGACSDEMGHESEELDMDNFLGLWLVLVVGCLLGVVMSLTDLALSARRHRRLGESFLRRLGTELRFVFRFDLNVKPVHGPLLSESDSSSGATSQLSAGSGGAGAEAHEREGAGAEGGAGAAAGARGSRRASRRSSLAAAEARRRRHSRRSLASTRE